MTDLVELVEQNRFVGREFLLWLWFESDLFETNLDPVGGEPCSIWFETQLTLANEGEETRIKSPSPGFAPEAKQALRQGKLPVETRVRMVLGALEYAWTFKADELATAGLKIPSVLKAEDDRYEALYERMRIVETFEGQLEALWSVFLALRLDSVWDTVVTPEMKKWARGKAADERAYKQAKARVAARAVKSRAKAAQH